MLLGLQQHLMHHNKLVLTRDVLGSGSTLEIVGGGFASSFLYDGAGGETIANISQIQGKDIGMCGFTVI